MAKYWTNRGLKRITDGDLDSASLRLAAFTGTAPAQSAIQDYNFIADLEAASGVTEAAASGYSRPTPTFAFAEDDTNNRANLTLNGGSAVTLGTSVAAGETWTMVALFDNAGGSDAARELIWVDVLSSSLATNGSNVTYTPNATPDTLAQA
jgi:hypothetical protein